ncbi:MAG: pyridoxamine 5'-phosphate oxidase family protein [Anaerolineales bacterium]
MTHPPVADRPDMPEYGLLPAEEGRGLLPWSSAAEGLARSRRYWFASSQPKGRPHLTPIWGLWLEDGFFFSTARSSRKSRNLRYNPLCFVSTEENSEAVILEGRAEVPRRLL